MPSSSARADSEPPSAEQLAAPLPPRRLPPQPRSTRPQPPAAPPPSRPRPTPSEAPPAERVECVSALIPWQQLRLASAPACRASIERERTSASSADSKSAITSFALAPIHPSPLPHRPPLPLRSAPLPPPRARGKLLRRRERLIVPAARLREASQEGSAASLMRRDRLAAPLLRPLQRRGDVALQRGRSARRLGPPLADCACGACRWTCHGRVPAPALLRPSRAERVAVRLARLINN